MIARILPPEEWHRLNGTEAEKAWPLFNQEHTRVIVVEEDGEIVATWTMLRVVHAECLWVKPSHRGAFGAAMRLFRWMRKVAEEWDSPVVITGAETDEVVDLIRRFGGYPMPCESFILPIGGNMTERAMGRHFHEQLSALVPDQHPEDEKHDEAVGKAIQVAIDGNPALAEKEYNQWAQESGYEPVRYLGTVDGKLRADIVTAVIEVDDQGTVNVLEERCP